LDFSVQVLFNRESAQSSKKQSYKKAFKMKKIIYMLLLALSGSMIAQTKTLVTPYGEKVTIIPGAGTADNGLTATTSGKVQMGGALIQPTAITTDAVNKLEIRSNGTTAAPVSAIKIVDGNQSAGRVLTGDANGVATWGDLPGSWTAALIGQVGVVTSTGGNFADVTTYGGQKIIGSGGSTNTATGKITVPTTGIYEITIPAYYDASATPGGGMYLIHHYVKVNGVTAGTSIQGQPNTGWGTNLTCAYVLSLNAGDVISCGVSTYYYTSEVLKIGSVSMVVRRL
jgi:hypothetical protein